MSDGEATWQRLGDEIAAADPAISWSTMMGFPCLRYEGAFFASLDHRNGDLLVKLAADDVGSTVQRGHPPRAAIEERIGAYRVIRRIGAARPSRWFFAGGGIRLLLGRLVFGGCVSRAEEERGE